MLDAKETLICRILQLWLSYIVNLCINEYLVSKFITCNKNPSSYDTLNNCDALVCTDGTDALKNNFHFISHCPSKEGRKNFSIKYKDIKSFENKNMDITVMLKKCFPVLALGVTEDLALCIPCYTSLQQHLTFMGKCLNLEENISGYCRTEGASSKNQIELRNVLYLISKSIPCSLGTVKTEGEYRERLNNSYNLKDVAKNESFVEIDQQELNIKIGHGQEVFDIKKEDAQNSDRFEDCLSYPKQYDMEPTVVPDQLVLALYKCPACTYQCKYNNKLQRHMIIHKNTSETKMYRCNLCTYQGRRKDHLKGHMVNIHKSASEVTMHKCEICAHQTRYKGAFNKHLRTHKNISELTLRECDMSVLETKHSGNASRNIPASKSASEILYKCQFCLYHTIYKYSLEQHILNHKGTSEMTKYKCEVCVYRTNLKDSLRRHMLTHKSTSEVATYKCELCIYQTKYKNSLQTHMLAHKEASEVIMYKCEMCEYQTKYKSNLEKHMVTHRAASEATVYKCATCTFQTKHKNYIQTHMLIHKTASEVNMHKCERCVFQTKVKASLRRHMLIHKSSSKVTTYKCEMCEYQAKRKANLRRHVLTHRSTSEVTTYKCEVCEYHTKCKGDLQAHVLTHKKDSEVVRGVSPRGLVTPRGSEGGI